MKLLFFPNIHSLPSLISSPNCSWYFWKYNFFFKFLISNSNPLSDILCLHVEYCVQVPLWNVMQLVQVPIDIDYIRKKWLKVLFPLIQSIFVPLILACHWRLIPYDTQNICPLIRRKACDGHLRKAAFPESFYQLFVEYPMRIEEQRKKITWNCFKSQQSR